MILKVSNLRVKKTAFALVLVSCTIIGAVATPEIEGFFSVPKPDDSLKRVLESPYSFERKTVTVEGYERCKFEGNTVWLSKRDCQRETKKVLWIAIDRNDKCWAQFEKSNNRIVKITGTFSRNITGHGAYCPGGLSNISEITLVK